MSASSQDNYGLLLSYLELISDYSDERHQENDYFIRRYDQLRAYGDCYTSDKLTHQHCLLVKNVQSGILELHCSRHYHKEVYFIRLSLRTLLRELRNPSVVKSHYLFLSVAADLSYKLVESTKATCCECFSTNRADSVYLLFAEINIHCQDFKKEVKIILISPSYEISKSSLYDEHDVYFKPPDNVSLEEEPLTTRIHSLLSLSSPRRLHYFPNNLEQLRSIRSLFQHVRCLTTEMNSYLIDKDSDKFQLSDSIIVHAGFLRNSDLDDFSFIGNEMSQLVMLGIQKTMKYMDLSGNRFEKLPFSIGRLNNLCVLTLQVNSLKYLPDSFCNLSSLTCLKIGSSQLEELPEDFFNLRKLKVLDLSSNKLKSFPRITMLQDSLNYLDLSNNGLTEFPDLQNAPNLENVELYDNKIKRVPAYIVKRSVLHKLNVSYNQVEELPFEEVRDDLIIHVGNNNFVIPPNEIVDLGMEKIKSYYKDLRRKKVDIIPEVKLILLGNTGAGKTTIGRNLSKHDHPPKPSDRTRVLEASTFDINREDKNFKFTVFDLAGHDVYDSTHRLFFSSNSIYILVVDMSLYNYQEFYPLVGKWYDMLTCYSPKCNVILVGTHEDVLKREQAEKILKEMRRELGKHVEKYCNHHPKRENVVLPDIVAELSINCRNKSHPSYGEIMNLLFKLCKLKKNVSLVSSVPYSWQQFEDALKTYKNKYYLSLDDLQLRIEELKITDVYTVLEYFNLTGKVLYFKSGKLGSYVFHQPLLIADALRSVFMHDNDQLLSKSSRSLLKFWLPKEEPIEVGEKIMNAAKLEGVTGVVLEAMGKDIDNGIFTKKCLEILFHARLGHDVDAELLVDLVKKFEYCYEINKLEAEGHNFYDYQPNEKTFCFPCYLKPSKSTKKLEEFFTTKFSDKSVSTQIIVDVGIRCIEVVTRLVVIIHNYASLAKLVWKYGMIAVIGQVKVLIQHTLLETGGFRITVSAQSEEKYKKQIHEKLWRIHECIIKLLTTLPGLQYQAFITCPVCIKSKSKKIHYFPLLHARKDFSETAEKLCPVCESYILVNELMMASASMYGYAQVENVAQFLKNDKFVQGEFTLIATLLEMDHRVKDIRYESSISNSPGPSYWIYLLVKYYVSEKGEDGYIEKLINSLQFLDLNDSAERLRDKVEDLRRLN
ncbi:Uncharacterised protein r2_g828 [Pycnogonum litorale]